MSVTVRYPCASEGCGHSINDHGPRAWLCEQCTCPFWVDPDPLPIGHDFGGMST